MSGTKVKESLSSMVGQGISSSPSSSSSSWPSSATTPAHLSQEYNSLLASGYHPTAHPAQATFQGEQSKYLAAGLVTEAKYGLMPEAKYGMGDSSGLETKYSSHLASQSQGNQVKSLKASRCSISGMFISGREAAAILEPACSSVHVSPGPLGSGTNPSTNPCADLSIRSTNPKEAQIKVPKQEVPSMRMIEHIHRPSAIHVKPSAKNIQSCHVPYTLSDQYDSLYTLNEVHLCAAF